MFFELCIVHTKRQRFIHIGYSLNTERSMPTDQILYQVHWSLSVGIEKKIAFGELERIH
jgi:hypothetical protein